MRIIDEIIAQLRKEQATYRRKQRAYGYRVDYATFDEALNFDALHKKKTGTITIMHGVPPKSKWSHKLINHAEDAIII